MLTNETSSKAVKQHNINVVCTVLLRYLSFHLCINKRCQTKPLHSTGGRNLSCLSASNLKHSNDIMARQRFFSTFFSCSSSPFERFAGFYFHSLSALTFILTGCVLDSWGLIVCFCLFPPCRVHLVWMANL